MPPPLEQHNQLVRPVDGGTGESGFERLKGSLASWGH